jgi:hypothetical protein
VQFAQLEMSIIQIAKGCMVVYNCNRDQNILFLVRVINKAILGLVFYSNCAAGVAP